MNKLSSKTLFMEGTKAGLPVAIGYIPIAIAFGLLAKSFDIPNYISLLMSFLIYAGASQFIGINLLFLGASFGEIVITTFILNLRHFLMTATLSQRLETRVSKRWRSLLAFGITDETFSVNVLRSDEKLSPYFMLGMNTIAFSAWNIGTWLGVFFAAGLPELVKASMGIALYAMFIGLLTPHLKKSKPVLVVAFLAIGISSLFAWTPILSGISNGWSIIIATIVSSVIGASLFREEEEHYELD